MRRAITKSTWAEIRTAYAGGIGLREIARNMNIPEGTVLARAKREGWSQHRDNAKALAKREEAAKAITPFEAASASMQQRGERHLGRMANIVEKTIPHVEAMEPSAILDRVDDVESWTRLLGELSAFLITICPVNKCWSTSRSWGNNTHRLQSNAISLCNHTPPLSWSRTVT